MATGRGVGAAEQHQKNFTRDSLAQHWARDWRALGQHQKKSSYVATGKKIVVRLQPERNLEL